jgi:hypothetical protein
MSFNELIEQVEQLSPPERQELRQRLNLLELADDPAYLARMGQRIDEIEAGATLTTADEVRELMAQRRANA